MKGPSTIEEWLQKLQEFERGYGNPGLIHPSCWRELSQTLRQLAEQMDGCQRMLWTIVDREGGKADITGIDLMTFPRGARLIVESSPENGGYTLHALSPHVKASTNAPRLN